MSADVNYVKVGRWALCYFCETIYSWDAGHFCGASWQHSAPDMPEDWVARARERSKKPPGTQEGAA